MIPNNRLFGKISEYNDGYCGKYILTKEDHETIICAMDTFSCNLIDFNSPLTCRKKLHTEFYLFNY